MRTGARTPDPVPQFDLRAQQRALENEIDPAIRQVIASGRFVLGPNAEDFEQEVARYLGVEHAVGCNSGTDALHLALVALGIGPGDEVITTPFSFIATAEAIFHAGARPVFVDIRPDTFNLDPDLIASAVSASTRAILPVHLFGQPAQMEPIRAVAQAHGLAVVEDCAQSFGARRGSSLSGSVSDAGCFSFYPTKNLGACGDAGLVTTGSPELARKLRALRNHGARARDDHPLLGFNSRLDELQAVVLRAKLRRIDNFNAARRRIASAYTTAFAGLPGVGVPHVDPGGQHVFHQYTLLLADRDGFVAGLRRRGVGCAVHYRQPIPDQPSMRAARVVGTLPTTRDIASRCVSLPMFPELTDAQVKRVVDAVSELLENRPRPPGYPLRPRGPDSAPSHIGPA